MKVDTAVRHETCYIAIWIVIFSILMEAIFLIIGKWDITVFWGNLLSGIVATVNFFLMGLTLQKAVTKEEKQAANTMKLSQTLRMLLLFITAALGVTLPCFHICSALIPLFFPRIAIALRPLFNKKRTANDN